MTMTLTRIDDARTLEISVRGKLEKDDYTRFVPQMEQLIERHGKLRILLDMRGFDGVSVGALWQDLKFDVKHHDDVERIAVIGGKRWMEWMTSFAKPFTSAEVKFFEVEDVDDARAWVSDRIAP